MRILHPSTWPGWLKLAGFVILSGVLAVAANVAAELVFGVLPALAVAAIGGAFPVATVAFAAWWEDGGRAALVRLVRR